MRKKRRKRGAENFASARDTRKEIVRFEVIENGVARGGGDGMGLISETVFERAGTALEGFDDIGSNEHRAERSVAAGNSLPGEDDVGLDAPMLGGEWFAGATDAGHHLVGDEKNAALAANFGNSRGVAFGRGGRAERGADDGLENKGGGRIRVIFREESVQIVRAGEMTFWKSFLERAVEAEARSDVPPLREKRLIRRASSDVAADGHGAERGAVIALMAGKNAIASGLSFFQMKLADDLDGGFRGFRTAGNEIDAAAFSEIRRSQSEQAGGKLFCLRRMELGCMRKSDLRRLFGHGAADFRDAVTDVDDSGLAGSIEEFAPVGGEDPAAFATDSDGEISVKMARKEGSVV